MKTRVFVFYAISILSFSLFAIAPSATSASFEGEFPSFELSQMLIESADHMMAVRY